jgi:hypothetical protein
VKEAKDAEEIHEEEEIKEKREIEGNRRGGVGNVRNVIQWL